MTNKIKITSFQGGLSNDRNVGQAGSFWNSKNIEYRKNSEYIELNKGSTNIFTLPVSSGTPSCMALWKNGGSFITDLLTFTNTKIISSTGVDYTFSSLIPVNVIEANNIKYIIGQSSIGTYTSSTGAVAESVASIGSSQVTRPAINFYGDLIIGNGTSICRYNKDGSLISWASGTTQPVIGGLEGTIMAITNIGPYIYVWCNNTVNTILYLWDGVSNRPSQVIKYSDTPIRNLALLGNQHYWWALKGNYSSGQSSIRTFSVGESYSPQLIVKSDYPDFPLLASKDNDANRLAFFGNPYGFVNDIESIGDIVYIPGYASIFGIGKYFPGQKISVNREFSIPGEYVQAMLSSGLSHTGIDCSGILYYAYNNGTGGTQPWSVAYINTGIKTDTQSPLYQLSGEIETMEYIAPSFSDGEDDRKIIVPFQIPDASTSIRVHVKNDRGSYVLVKTIDSTAYGIGYKVAEINISGRWRTKQLKFELITSNSSFTPRLYTGITNISVTVGAKE